MKFEICTFFTSMASPPLVASSFWFLLVKNVEAEHRNPMFNNPQTDVLYELQKLGMPDHNDCLWHIAVHEKFGPLFDYITTYEGCEKLLAFKKAATIDPDLAGIEFEDSDNLTAALNVADEFGYNVHGPWVWLLKPKKKVTATNYKSGINLPEKAWQILSYDDCPSDKRWLQVIDYLKDNPRKGVAYFTDSKGKVKVRSLDRANLAQIRAWGE